jgi:hypothetical protein
LATLLCVGCANQTTTVTSVEFVQGTPNGQAAGTQPTTMPAGPAPVVKTWLNSGWINPSGSGWTENGDSADLNVWCDSNGDWGISHTISNHGIGWHSYETTVVFGHLEGNDPNSFVPYASHVSSTIIVHHGRSNTTMATGDADPAIRENFNSINAARASLHEH